MGGPLGGSCGTQAVICHLPSVPSAMGTAECEGDEESAVSCSVACNPKDCPPGSARRPDQGVPRDPPLTIWEPCCSRTRPGHSAKEPVSRGPVPVATSSHPRPPACPSLPLPLTHCTGDLCPQLVSAPGSPDSGLGAVAISHHPTQACPWGSWVQSPSPGPDAVGHVAMAWAVRACAGGQLGAVVGHHQVTVTVDVPAQVPSCHRRVLCGPLVHAPPTQDMFSSCAQARA